MSKFSDQDRTLLLLSPFVKSVSASQVQFTPEFKLKALKLHDEGMRPAEIFFKLGIEPGLFLLDYPKKCLQRWKKIFEEEGLTGLKGEKRGKKATGRPKKEVLKDESDFRERIAYLEAEVDFLKKLRALEEKSANKKSSRS